MHKNIATTCILGKIYLGDISYDGALRSYAYIMELRLTGW